MPEPRFPTLALPHIRLPYIRLPLIVLPVIAWNSVDMRSLYVRFALPRASWPALGAIGGMGLGEAAWGVTPWAGAGVAAYEFGGLAVGLASALAMAKASW